MNDDLVSLRLLLVATAQPSHDLWRQGVGMASVPIEFAAQDAASAIAALAKGGVDICIVDSELPNADRAAVIEAAHGPKPSPLVFISAPPGTARVDPVNGLLVKPTSADEARKLVERCARGKIPTRVLIVDDSGTMRSIVRKILSVSRFALDIHEASEGLGALEQLRTGKFGLVFLDYNMPGLNGFETMSEIKRWNMNMAVVMMTSTLDSAIANRAHASGAFAFLKKPFYPADIDAVLERYYGLDVPTGR
jgi:DNA-binding NtrC family response regulator